MSAPPPQLPSIERKPSAPPDTANQQGQSAGVIFIKAIFYQAQPEAADIIFRHELA
jgi:hypothetical protein